MQPRRSRLALGVALALLGLTLFFGNVVGHWSVAVLTALGVGLLAASLDPSCRRCASLGCLALAVAALLEISDVGLLQSRVDIWAPLLLGVVCLWAYVVRRRWSQLYPLVLAAVLFFASADGLFGLHNLVTGPAEMAALARWWPALIVLVGVWLLLGARWRGWTSRALGAGLLFLVGSALVLIVGGASFTAPWAAVTAPLRGEGVFNMLAPVGGRGLWPPFQLGNVTLADSVDQSVDAAGVTLLSVANAGGSTRIYRLDGNQIQVHAIKQVWAINQDAARQALDATSLDVTASDGRVDVRARSPSTAGIAWFHPSGWVDVEIGVPSNMEVRVTSTSGRIRLEGTSGDATVVSTSGRVELQNVTGDVEARLVSGGLRVDNLAGAISASTVSGNVEIVNASRLRDVVTTSGRIIIDGVLNQNGNIRSTSGDVRLFVSPESAFQLDYATVSGKVQYDLPLAVGSRLAGGAPDDGRRAGSGGGLFSIVTTGPRHFVGVYNRGTAAVTIRTISGDLRLMRSGS